MEDREERTIREEREMAEFWDEHPEFRPSKSKFSKDVAQAEGIRSERFRGQAVFIGLDFSERSDDGGGQHAAGHPIWKNTSIEQREARQRVERIMETLSEVRQDLLRRIYWEQQTYKQVADDYGVTPQAIHQRVETARGAFSRALIKMAEAGELNLVEEEGI